MAENPFEQVTDMTGSNTLKSITNVIKKSTVGSGELEIPSDAAQSSSEIATESTPSTAFKVASTNLPEKTGFWTKVRNTLLYEVKVELTPYQQKVEDDINEFLHQEITWQSFKDFLFQEVPITFKGKRVF